MPYSRFNARVGFQIQILVQANVISPSLTVLVERHWDVNIPQNQLCVFGIH